jgi:hypothetical protein
MKGYLLKHQEIKIGGDTFIESVSSENNYAVIFEDDGDTGYFYGAQQDSKTGELQILDMLLVYDVDSFHESERTVSLDVIWSTDWLKCGLILNNDCQALFDFEDRKGYNRLGFPPPVLWSNHQRKLTDEMVASVFA